jgi:GTP cyclohydrolase I
MSSGRSILGRPEEVAALIDCVRRAGTLEDSAPDMVAGAPKLSAQWYSDEALLKETRADTEHRVRQYIRNAVAYKNRLMLQDLPSILSTGFPMEKTASDPGLITQGPIRLNSLCPHHLLPVIYEAYVSYLPQHGGTVLGLSKLARLSIELARRPVLQEQLTNDIADVLFAAEDTSANPLPRIHSQGSAVQLVGKHTCMSCRGVLSDALTLTTSLRGAYAHNTSVKDEFYKSIESINRSSLLK